MDENGCDSSRVHNVYQIFRLKICFSSLSMGLTSGGIICCGGFYLLMCIGL